MPATNVPCTDAQRASVIAGVIVPELPARNADRAGRSDGRFACVADKIRVHHVQRVRCRRTAAEHIHRSRAACISLEVAALQAERAIGIDAAGPITSVTDDADMGQSQPAFTVDAARLIRAIRDDDRVLNEWLCSAPDKDSASPRCIRENVDVKIAARKR